MFFHLRQVFTMIFALVWSACQLTPGQQTFNAAGLVKSVTSDSRQVVIAHEDIPGFMQAMTMEFAVKDPALLADIFPEDQVAFTIEQTPDSLYIVTIQSEAPDPRIVASHTPDVAVNSTPEEEQEEFRPFPAPDFLLTDQDGQPFVLSSLHGKVVLIDFIFTTCPGPCPILSRKFSHVQRRLGEHLTKDVMLLSVTIDPRRDTPEALRAYAKRYKADAEGWKFLTGTPLQILMIATQYEAEYRGGSEGITDHRLRTCVINQEGIVVKTFNGVNYTTEDLLAEVEGLLRSGKV